MSNLSGFSNIYRMDGSSRVDSSAPASTTMSQDEILSLVKPSLADVEAMFAEHLASPISIVDEIGSFVRSSGGKRVRPTVHLLSAQMCEYKGPHDVLLATVLEFIHCATLIHDDIIDGATTRRGRPSVNINWGNNVTVLFGDYLFAKAMELALQAGSLRVMKKLADVTLRMTEGEMLQTRYEGRIDLTVREYLDLVDRKTAALFACCCELAGVLSGASEDEERRLHDYGRNLGLAFQLVDDVLDFTGDPAVLGKPAASDLREGKATLAVIDLIDAGSDEARRLARRIMDHGGEACPEIETLTQLLHDEGAIERSRQAAADYAEQSIDALDAFPDSPARRALRTLPELLLQRNR